MPIPSDGNFSQMLLAFAHSTDTNTITIGALLRLKMTSDTTKFETVFTNMVTKMVYY